MGFQSLGYIGFESPRYEEWRTLAPHVYGLPVDDEVDGSLRIRLDDRSYRIALHPGTVDRVAYLGWEVESTEELDAYVATLEARGVEVSRGDAHLARSRDVRRLVWITDPFGFRHEFFLGQLSTNVPFQGVRPSARFVTGDRGVGHAVVVVPDGVAAFDFYVNTMGFLATDVLKLPSPMGEMWFLRCNSRHHSFAFIAMPGMVGFDHLMIESTSLVEVGIAYDRAAEVELPIATTLGQHYADETTSFYARTPTGWNIEIGYRHLQVGSEWETRYFDIGGSGRSEVWGHHWNRELGRPSTVKPVEHSN